jgi:hypothetical protein
MYKNTPFSRRSFIGQAIMLGMVASPSLVLTSCAKDSEPDLHSLSSNDTKTVSMEEALPPAAPDSASQFGVDLNINIQTIDSYLGRTDAVYRDMRMLFDPANYESIGGQSYLAQAIDGFRIVPYPYLATLPPLPTDGAYTGDTAFALTFDHDGSIAQAVPNYAESQLILQDLFPKDKAIFLMCGGGGYAAMTKSLLVFLGWDESRLYNVGAGWEYSGSHGKDLIVYGQTADSPDYSATWRADYAYIDFSRLHPIQ